MGSPHLAAALEQSLVFFLLFKAWKSSGSHEIFCKNMIFTQIYVCDNLQASLIPWEVLFPLLKSLAGCRVDANSVYNQPEESVPTLTNHILCEWFRETSIVWLQRKEQDNPIEEVSPNGGWAQIRLKSLISELNSLVSESHYIGSCFVCLSHAIYVVKRCLEILKSITKRIARKRNKSLVT